MSRMPLLLIVALVVVLALQGFFFVVAEGQIGHRHPAG